MLRSPSAPKDISLIPPRNPTWGLGTKDEVDTSHKIKATWPGHTCFLVELPPRPNPGARGVRVLFDLIVFGDRCSPSQWLQNGTPPCPANLKRYQKWMLSCNQSTFSHLSKSIILPGDSTITTLTWILIPFVFCPNALATRISLLGNGHFFETHGIPDTHIHILDWCASS